MTPPAEETAERPDFHIGHSQAALVLERGDFVQDAPEVVLDTSLRKARIVSLDKYLLKEQPVISCN